MNKTLIEQLFLLQNEVNKEQQRLANEDKPLPGPLGNIQLTRINAILDEAKRNLGSKEREYGEKLIAEIEKEVLDSASIGSGQAARTDIVTAPEGGVIS